MRSVSGWLLLGVAAFLASCARVTPGPLGSGPAATPILATPNPMSSASTLWALGKNASDSFHAQDAWAKIPYHGLLVIAAGYDYTQAKIGALSCAACHGGASPLEPSANSRAPNCFACHEGGPTGGAFHPDGWLDPYSNAFHGDTVLAANYDLNRAMAGNLPCLACHAGLNVDAASPNSRAPSCYTCHGGGPDGSAGHPPGWGDPKSPSFHGIAPVADGFEYLDYGVVKPGNLTCSACHAGNSPNEVSVNSRAPNCFTCHAGGPDGSPGHPVGWNAPSSPGFHGKVVENAGFDYTKALSGALSCDVCHAGKNASQVSPIAGAPNCFLCHAGGPNGSPGHPAGWAQLGSPSFHGSVVEAAGGYTKAKSGTLTCNTCHAGSSPTAPSPVSTAPNCYSCHAGGPDGSPGHPAQWANPASPQFHGWVVASASFDYTQAKSGNLTCNTCHAGQTPTQTSPVLEAPNCFSCHEGGPSGAEHRAGWETPRSSAFHGVYLAQNGGYQVALSNHRTCNACHNTTSNGPSPVADAPNCFVCHLGGPSGSPGHPLEWALPTSHGVAAQANLASCAGCHNTVAAGMPNPAPDVPVDCWSCHRGPGG